MRFSGLRIAAILFDWKGLSSVWVRKKSADLDPWALPGFLGQLLLTIELGILWDLTITVVLLRIHELKVIAANHCARGFHPRKMNTAEFIPLLPDEDEAGFIHRSNWRHSLFTDAHWTRIISLWSWLANVCSRHAQVLSNRQDAPPRLLGSDNVPINSKLAHPPHTYLGCGIWPQRQRGG